MSIYVGMIVKYNDSEWAVTAHGSWGVRIERGFGQTKSVCVVQPHELQRARRALITQTSYMKTDSNDGTDYGGQHIIVEGEAWYTFTTHYTFKGEEYLLEIKARSLPEAIARFQAIGTSHFIPECVAQMITTVRSSAMSTVVIALLNIGCTPVRFWRTLSVVFAVVIAILIWKGGR